ncbi:hypothetical protein MTO96_011884 [Rhipicephalus appendiculatus]
MSATGFELSAGASGTPNSACAPARCYNEEPARDAKSAPPGHAVPLSAPGEKAPAEAHLHSKNSNTGKGTRAGSLRVACMAVSPLSPFNVRCLSPRVPRRTVRTDSGR